MTDQPFPDIPLFREIQRLLAAGGGPVNLEVARQIAEAIAAQHSDADPSPQDTAAYDAAVRSAEQVAAGYTRLELDEPIRTTVLRRREWVAASLQAWRWVYEELAARFVEPMAAEGAGQMNAVMSQITPLLLGAQAGTLIGHLSLEAMGRYDLPLPRDDEGSVFFVEANIARIGRDYGLDPGALRRWLALRETSRHLVVNARPWTLRYLRSLISELVASIEIDTSELERRLEQLQSGGLGAFQEGVDAQAAIPISPTERHARARANVRSFLAVFEGYAHFVSEQVGDQIDASDPRVEEAMLRHVASPSEGQSLLEALLGLERDRALEASGKTFCAAVAKLRGPLALSQVWAAPDFLPSMEEVKDPFQWMERVPEGGD